jgi:hypothetical protein
VRAGRATYAGTARNVPATQSDGENIVNLKFVALAASTLIGRFYPAGVVLPPTDICGPDAHYVGHNLCVVNTKASTSDYQAALMLACSDLIGSTAMRPVEACADLYVAEVLHASKRESHE